MVPEHDDVVEVFLFSLKFEKSGRPRAPWLPIDGNNAFSRLHRIARQDGVPNGTVAIMNSLSGHNGLGRFPRLTYRTEENFSK